tara:strand:- start:281 stop:436 length:156 start_codon:yes stop_codon:yes gene_type:complete
MAMAAALQGATPTMTTIAPLFVATVSLKTVKFVMAIALSLATIRMFAPQMF